MRVLHLPFTYHPDPAGGTEVYVAALARELRHVGVESVVAAPSTDGSARAYAHDGVPVHRFPVPADGDLREWYGAGSDAAATALTAVLDEWAPDVVHLHALTRGVSILTARLARRRRLPLVFTYHTPTASCHRGTLLRDGLEVCDGRLELARCTACVLREHGLRAPVAALLSRMPPAAGALLGRRALRGGMWTALRMTELMALRHDSFRALAAEADAVVAVSDWVHALLRANGVPDAKLVLSRQGVPGALPDDVPAVRRGAEGVVRAAFLGRLDPTKGVHVVVEALRRARGARVTLDIYGVAQGAAGLAYEADLRRRSAGDVRVRFLSPVPAHEVVRTLAGYDLTVVPSQWLETGPLVVLESFAAGVPVLGSRRGGIAELVRDDVDGVLVEPEDVEAWRGALQRLAADPQLLNALRAAVRTPRTMADAAADMVALYRRLLGGVAARPLADAGASV